MFEGLKAFRHANGRVALFRVDDNLKRLASGAPRLSMPVPDVAMLKEAMVALVAADKDWVPSQPGTALYLRPTYIATEAFLGVRPSTRYLLYVITSPVGAYYAVRAEAGEDLGRDRGGARRHAAASAGSRPRPTTSPA